MPVPYFNLIERSNLPKNPFVADKQDLRGFSRDSFLEGREILNWPKGVSFIASNSEQDGVLTDFVVNDAMVCLVVPRLLRFIRTLKVPACQALSAIAISSTGARRPVYILNFTEFIEGIDLDNSAFGRYTDDWPDPTLRGKIDAFTKPVLVLEKVKAWDLFRCSEYPDELFASERFRQRFRKKDMTGVSFSPVGLS